MKVNPFIFRNYDIRGVAGEDLDADKVEAIGKAYGTFLQRRKIRQAVVGRDCRLSGEEYARAFIRGLAQTGVDAIDLGMVMTQMVYFGQYRFQTNGGAMITASHNPWNFNGFKLATGYSRTTETRDVQEIQKIVEQENYFVPDRSGKITELAGEERKAFVEDYMNDVLKRVRLKKRFRVVVDTGMGTTGMFNPEIFERAGCEVIGQNLEVDGHFPVGTLLHPRYSNPCARRVSIKCKVPAESFSAGTHSRRSHGPPPLYSLSSFSSTNLSFLSCITSRSS